ncbi:hypothetical protein DFJ73DRAFT_800576 [Zopfochytrium polystomum]|nr:hypothetical protein DFJ73DRAFT_800576 [Zopfochytrium polystomum]
MTTAALFFGVPDEHRGTREAAGRITHHQPAIVLDCAALAYYAMANAEGQVTVPTTDGSTREFFYVRYIDWTLTTPLLIADLMILAGVSNTELAWTIFLDLVMIVTGLIGALDSTNRKWGWFTFGCVAFLGILYQLVVVAPSVAASRSPAHGSLFNTLSYLTLVLWTVYPIIWGISEGGNKISVDAEVSCYAVLDVLAKAGFGAILLTSHAKLENAVKGGTSTDNFVTAA